MILISHLLSAQAVLFTPPLFQLPFSISTFLLCPHPHPGWVPSVLASREVVFIALLTSPRQVTLPCFLSLLFHLAGLRLLQLRMEKEEMEEELGEKIEVLQRELGQARAGAGDTRQVEELKKVCESWGGGGRAGKG